MARRADYKTEPTSVVNHPAFFPNRARAGSRGSTTARS